MNQNLAFKFTAEVNGQQAVEKFKNSLDHVGGAAEKLHRGLETVTKGLEIFAAAFAIEKGIEFAKGLLEMGSNLAHLSEKTGISVKDLAGFQAAAELSEVSVGELSTSLKKLAVNQVEAANGNLQMRAAFKAVGVAVKEANGDLVPTGTLMKRLADGFSQLKDGPQKAALAVKIFGRSGSELIPFLNEGSEGLTKFGVKIDDEFAERARHFEDSMKQIGNSVKGAGIEALGKLLPTLQDIVDAIKESPQDTSGLVGAMDILGEATRVAAIGLNYLKEGLLILLDVIATLVIAGLVGAVDGFKVFSDVVNTAAKGLIAFVTGDYAGVYENFKNIGSKAAKGIKDGFNNQGLLTQDFVERTGKRLSSADAFDRKLSKHSLIVGDGQAGELPEAKAKGSRTANTSGIGGTERDRVKEFLALQEQENKQLAESLGDYRLTAVELDKVKAARKLDNDALKASKGLNKDQQEQLKQGVAIIKEHREEDIELAYQQQRTFGYGAKKAFDDYVENATNAAKNAQMLFSNAFKGMEDAMLHFVKTGDTNFSKFAEAIIDDINRIIIRQQIIAPIVGAIGGAFSGGGSYDSGSYSSISFANGGIMSARGSLPLHKYAGGGVANSPQMAIFGEGSRPEAYVPLPDGRSIPVNMKNGGGGCSVIVNVNSDSGQTDSKSQSESGKQLGTLIGNAVKAELIKQKRPGGLIA